MHADSVETVISRLEGDPINITRVMIKSLDILSIQKMMMFGNKKVHSLDIMVEFMGIDSKTQDLRFNELYSWDPMDDTFRIGSKSHVLDEIMTARNWDEQNLNQELKNRKKVLEYMVEKDLDEYEVVALIQSYY